MTIKPPELKPYIESNRAAWTNVTLLHQLAASEILNLVSSQL